VIFLTGCVATKSSYKTKGEEVALNITEDVSLIAYATMRPQEIPDLASRSRGVADMAGKAISAAVQGIIFLVDKEKKKYTADYQSTVGQCYFYDQISPNSPFDPTGMQFTGFTLIRMIQDKKGNSDTALYARFSVDMNNAYEIINNSTFSLKLDELKVDYSKAKIMALKWYEPWSWFMASKYPKLNMDFEIVIASSYVTQDGAIFDNVPIGKFYLILRDIPMSSDDPEYKGFYESIVDKPLLGRSFLVPRSFGYYYPALNQIKPCYGQGIYNIVTNVTESSRSNFVSELLFENSTVMINQMGNTIQNKLQSK
jgi:hypothetical protein